MKHTPYGYFIQNGKAVINEEEAENLRTLCENYLNGMSFAAAAASVGLQINHGGVKRIVHNQRYLGDSYYPAILTKEVMDAVEEERLRRQAKMGRDHMPQKTKPELEIQTSFFVPRVYKKHLDPVKQAEYAYSLIRNRSE